jgi:hypothetical protein
VSTEYPGLDGYIADFIAKQHMFFVATAAPDGLVNVSPKGGTGTLRVIDDTTVAYLDLTGSGIETIAHTRADGRITLMWCAFEGPPNIVRVHGTARAVSIDDPEWQQWESLFPANPGARAVIIVTAERVSDSCGMAVPEMSYVRDRDHLDRWAHSKGSDGLRDYWKRKNLVSLDGLPGLPAASDN